MARRDRQVVLALGLAGAVGPADVGVDQRDEVGVVGVEVVRGPRAVALVGELQRAFDDVALGLDPDPLAAKLHSAHYCGAPCSTPTQSSARGSTACVEDLPGVSLFDAHTHVGQNDPDGFKQTPEELLEALAAVDAKALVFPMHEPDGYTPANDFVMDAVARSNGTLRALCRVQPKDPGCVDEARRCLDAGVNGIKLHPRAEQFTLSEPSVRELVAAAHEHKATVLIHAGRGIPALGRGHGAAVGRVPRGPDHPRPLRDLRPVVAVARAARPPEPLHRHRVVGARRRAGDVRPVPAEQRRVGERLALRPAAHRRHADDADGVPGRPHARPAARGHGRADGARAGRRAAARARAAARRAAEGARPADRARRHPPHDGDGPRVRARRLLGAAGFGAARVRGRRRRAAGRGVLRRARAARPVRRAPGAARGRPPDPRRRAPARVRADRRPHARRADPGAARPPAPDARGGRAARAQGRPRG